MTKKDDNDYVSKIDDMVSKARVALKAYMNMDQEKIDRIVKAMAMAGVEEHMKLAKMAFDETKRGVYEDKIIKNLFATEYIYNSIKNEKTVGIINENEYEDYEEIAEPVGVIAGVTPVTNPTSTTMFKAIICTKTRNPIIFAFHPAAQISSSEAARVLRDAAVEAGAPPNCIQWIEHPSIEATDELMNNPGINLILATGGSGMVKAAYSTGKPALGVGPGNVPCYIEKSANIQRACTDLILSKTFDNGMICASEQSVIVDREKAEEFENYMKENNCYFLTKEEIPLLSEIAIDKSKCAMSPSVVGQSAYSIAKNAGIKVDEETKILLARLDGVGDKYPLSREKLSPILAYYVVDGYKEGIKLMEKIIEFGGMGHSAVLHSQNEEIIELFSNTVKAGRLIINSPSTHGAIGDIYNTNLPSLTLGCGSYGKNSTTSNVSAVNLINIKRMARRRINMQWFKIPGKIYFEFGATQYLKDMPDINRAFIVTDPYMVKLGYVDRILYYLRKREKYVHSEIFSDVESDPSVDTI
ncbi:MAG: aldehyde dehydrogenase family protein, partial [Clostridia bacterium]